MSKSFEKNDKHTFKSQILDGGEKQMSSIPAISAAIKVRMTRLGITQKQLARRTGVAQSVISNNINGRNEWQLVTLDRLAKGLGWNDATDIALAARQERKSPQSSSAGNEIHERNKK